MADLSDAETRTRYTRTAIILHWGIAVLIVWQIGSGLWMVPAIEDATRWVAAFWIYQLHKSTGLLVLALSILRLVWRLTHPPPPLLADPPPRLRQLSGVMHALLYGLMIAVPIAGWVVVSSSPLGLPTDVFGTFTWPHLPVSTTIEPAAKTTHRLLGLMLGALAIGHACAALWHHVVWRDQLLRRMWPKWPKR